MSRSCKCFVITQVLLKNMFEKFYGIANALSHKRWCCMNLDSEPVEEKQNIPSDVPVGHNPVYVGSERRRFIVPTTYMNHPLFRELLHKAEEEFGFGHQMGLLIPCDEVTFEYLTLVMASNNSEQCPALKTMERIIALITSVTVSKEFRLE